ncbi:MAG: hypothetical protein JWM42_2639 [Burkholderia sp.]|nr:hypothetical protein [Burkholderia sp.]
MSLRLCMLPLLVVLSVGSVSADDGFPRLMGMNIGEKNYDDPVYQKQLARMDIVILGFYRGWGERRSEQPMRDAVRELKRLNPDMLVGQYTLLNEANDDKEDTAEHDKQHKLDSQDWWLRKAAGERVQWTSQYHAWDINLTDWTRPDDNGDRYPQWLARRDYRVFFKPVPEFDIWYFDNVMLKQRIASADWKREGKNQAGDDPRIQQAFRLAQATHWKQAHQLAPERIQMGNADNDLSFPEYKGKLQGVFLEGLMGYSWSLYSKNGWDGMMGRYHAVFGNLGAPRIVGFNVVGSPRDYRLLRFALGSCLMNDGYFSFTDVGKGYSSVPWFDEYDVRLGKAIDPPQVKAWRNGVYRRRFENGMVLVNPGILPRRVAAGEGYAHFRGRQAPQLNNGLPVKSVVLEGRDGVVLVKRAKK